MVRYLWRVVPQTSQGYVQKDATKPELPPVFLNRPLNLNEDGTAITYKKSHAGPYAMYWEQADAEEMERLFTSGTLRSIHASDIPSDRRATYMNPVCSEKERDTGAVKFRTRLQ